MSKSSVRCSRRVFNPEFKAKVALAALRQYIPKKMRMETVTDEELTLIQNRINHRPRKPLGFKTPYEVFHASLIRVSPRP
jgi:hypothetical protein